MNKSRLRLRLPSPALIISCVALFAAFGGGAFAATSLSRSALNWHTAATLNGWTLYQNGYANAGYALDSDGVVHLRGALKDGGSGMVAFTLPKGYRPTHDLYMPIYSFHAAVGSLNVLPNGDVIPFGNYVGRYAGLDGVSFGAGE